MNFRPSAAPSIDAAQLLQTGLQYHRAGRLAEAETLYRRILEHEPGHAEATHFVGMIAHQSGRHAEAAELIASAIERAGTHATPYMHNNLAEVLSALQRNDDAIGHYRKAIALDAGYGAAHNNLGVALNRVDRFSEAMAAFKRAIAIDPKAIDPRTNLGNLYQQLQRFDFAIAEYREALAIDPGDAQTHNNLGNALREAGELEAAIASFQRAISLQPGYADAHYNLGVALWKLDRFAPAEAAFRSVLALRPELAEAYNNLGEVLRCQDKIAEAEDCFTRALDFASTRAEAFANLGALAYGHGSPDDALDALRQAIILEPQRADFRKSLGSALLLTRHFAAGWKNRESRWHQREGDFAKVREDLRYPWWKGESLAGRTLLVSSEQGVGDELWASGMYQELIDGPARDGRVVIECRPKLLPLFQRSVRGADFVPRTTPPDERVTRDIDFHIACGSLGNFLRPSLDSIPRHESTGGAYLLADEARTAQWRARLADLGPGLKVGICWRSNDLKGERVLSCTELAQWNKVLCVEGVHFINLQYDECAPELDAAEARCGVSIVRFPEVDMFDDLDETAALMRALDLVISAPTSVSILSAALGVPTWQLTYSTEWQCHGFANNQWYPAMRNYPRRWNQSWETVLAQIAFDLGAVATGHAALVRDRDPTRTIEAAHELHVGGNLEAARPLYERVLESDPDNAEALHLLGLLKHQQGDNDAAISLLQKALRLHPDDAEYHHNLGIIFKAKEDNVAAIRHYREALKLRPRFAEAANNLGVALRECLHIAEAEKSFARAIELRPHFVLAQANLGATLNDNRRFDQAEAVLRAALAADPGLVSAHVNLLLALSAQGRVREAWPEYEWRWQRPDSWGRLQAKRPFHQAEWTGSDSGVLLVWGEQGVGDQIWSSGMFGDLKDRADAGRVRIECMPKLVPLFRRSFPWTEVIAQSDPPDPRCMEGVEFQIAAGSLGKHFRQELADFPKREETGGGYLVADPGREAYWRDKLGEGGTGFKVGISWRSTNMRGERALSCTRLGQWRDVFNVPGVRFINLQYDQRQAEAELREAEAMHGVKIERYPEVDMLDDLDETAALMRNLDLVISAPTSVSILSAALGVPTWQMNHGVEWQLHGQANNPWYPAMTNYARRWDQPWEDILKRMANDLQVLTAKPATEIAA